MSNQEEEKEETTEIEVWSSEDFFKTYDQMFKDFRRNIMKTWTSSPFTEPDYWERSVIPRVIQKPPVNLVDHGDSFELKAEVPGFEKENIDIEVTENSVTITGKKQETKETTKEKYRLNEIRSRSFKRKIMFPEKVKANRGTARIEKGLLTISVPKETPTDVEEKHKITIT